MALGWHWCASWPALNNLNFQKDGRCTTHPDGLAVSAYRQGMMPSHLLNIRSGTMMPVQSAWWIYMAILPRWRLIGPAQLDLRGRITTRFGSQPLARTQHGLSGPYGEMANCGQLGKLRAF